MSKKVVLLILDGWGLGPKDKYNAIDNAVTPTIDMLLEKYPWCRFKTDGPSVGLPEGQFGTSEANHLVIGSGTVPKQDYFKVNVAMEDGSFDSNDQLNGLINHVKEHDGALHLGGVLSDGGVHSHIEHLLWLLDKLKREGFEQPVWIHVFTDGRDTAPHSAPKYLEQLNEHITDMPNVKVATVQGRYYLDRDKDWDKTEKAFDLIYNAQAEKQMDTWKEAIDDAYANMREGIDNDQYVGHYVIGDYDGVKPGDGFCFTHFRADRAKQLMQRVEKEGRQDVWITSFYKPTEELGYTPLFVSDTVEMPLSEVIAQAGKSQAHITETEKYVHVTYYFNGRREKEEDGEEWKLYESNRAVKPFYNYDPAMRAHEFTDEILGKINEGKDFVLVNFSNTDMVGHTGNYEAAVIAAEAVDYCVSRIYELLEGKWDEYVLVVTADHGNSDEMWDYEANEPHTQHTFNPVFCIFVGENIPEVKLSKEELGTLDMIAPSVCELMGLPKPGCMRRTGVFG